jgi:hypothetical protein
VFEPFGWLVNWIAQAVYQVALFPALLLSFYTESFLVGGLVLLAVGVLPAYGADWVWPRRRKPSRKSWAADNFPSYEQFLAIDLAHLKRLFKIMEKAD